jgi:peptidoglycan/xylan/chitin deacetylase (PgdA/CDA1 family)
VKRIAAAGHEIASHGFDHELVYRQSPEAFREDVRCSRRLLQDLTGPGSGIAPPTRSAGRVGAADPVEEATSRLDVFPIRAPAVRHVSRRRCTHRMDLGTERPSSSSLPTVRIGR